MMGADKPDFQFDDRAERGVVVERALPPGDYVLSGFSLFWANTSFTPKKAVAIRFTVNSGQATYLGYDQYQRPARHLDPRRPSHPIDAVKGPKGRHRLPHYWACSEPSRPCR